MISQKNLGILLKAEIKSILEVQKVKNYSEKSNEAKGESLEARQ